MGRTFLAEREKQLLPFHFGHGAWLHAPGHDPITLQSSWALLCPGFHLLGWRRLWPWHLALPFPDSCAPAGGVSYLITQLSTLTFDHLKLFICFHVHILPSVSSPPGSCLQICERPFSWRSRSVSQGWPQSSVLRHPPDGYISGLCLICSLASG